MCFSDFPFPEYWPNFMEHQKLLQYLISYADQFSLVKHIYFERTIVKVERSSDREGAYDVTYRCSSREDKPRDERETYDFVMVCCGKFSEINMVKYENSNSFKGDISHAQMFRGVEKYRDQKVCVVGVGNTALDIAVDLVHVCSQVYVSTRTGTYVVKRLGKRGIPFDCYYKTRLMITLRNLLPTWMTNSILEHMCNNTLDHELVGLKPKYRFSQLFPTINDFVDTLVAYGKLKFVPEVERITNNGELYLNGGRRLRVDAIVMATGYRTTIPFMHPLIRAHDGIVQLYDMVFPPTCKGVCFIGFINTMGAITIASEMQARWAVQVFKGNHQLPSESEMLSACHKMSEFKASRYEHKSKFHYLVNEYAYLERLATKVGCQPRWTRLLRASVTSRRGLSLLWNMLTGILTSQQYRLHGTHWNPMAESWISSTWSRVLAPYRSRGEGGGEENIERSHDNKNVGYSSMIFFAGVILTILLAIIVTIVS